MGPSVLPDDPDVVFIEDVKRGIVGEAVAEEVGDRRVPPTSQLPEDVGRCRISLRRQLIPRSEALQLSDVGKDAVLRHLGDQSLNGGVGCARVCRVLLTIEVTRITTEGQNNTECNE